jgi:mannose-6-phosphate isomerase-like protein (cupin superfamily)
MKTIYDDIQKYVTRDGSIIRELMHPGAQGDSVVSVKNQSLAEATVAVGMATMLHLHIHTEELYHITSGKGLMTLGDEQFNVAVGDTICIPPGTPHCIKNTGGLDLKILCSCSPAYSHEDTHILDA